LEVFADTQEEAAARTLTGCSPTATPLAVLRALQFVGWQRTAEGAWAAILSLHPLAESVCVEPLPFASWLTAAKGLLVDLLGAERDAHGAATAHITLAEMFRAAVVPGPWPASYARH
jgi:hypothetical protein